MKSFDQVTRATQRKRWRRLAEIALQRYGIADARIRFVSDTGNVVFRVDTPNQRYALRIDPRPADAGRLAIIEAEMCWLSALRHDTALAVPEPVSDRDGVWVPEVSTVGIPDAHPATMVRWMAGQPVGDRPLPETMVLMGAFMAYLHDHAERFSFPDGITRPRTEWSKLAYWQDQKNDTSATLTSEQRAVCAIAVDKLLADIEQIGTERDYGLIHADLHPNNCLLYNGELGVVDFGDCRFGSHFYDMSVPLTYLAEHHNYETLRAAFYKGYGRVRTLPERTEAAVQVFMVARAFDHIEWIHFAWPSPTHHPWGPALLASAIQQVRRYCTGMFF